MNISSIRQSLENIDYAWTNPKTYLVFIPGISLIIQKIQMANTLPLINNVTSQNNAQADAKSRKFANICKWHLRGAIVQMIASIIAIKVFSLSLFSLLTFLATYEAADTLSKSLRNPIRFYEFYPNGNVRNMIVTSACNMF